MKVYVLEEEDTTARVIDMSLRNILSQVKSSNDLIYIALMSIYAASDESSSKLGARKFVLPELVYLLDEQSLINLMTYFGGETISIPKASILKDQLYGVLAYYYSEIEGIKDWKDVISKIGLEYSELLEQKLKLLSKQVADNLEGIRLLPPMPGGTL